VYKGIEVLGQIASDMLNINGLLKKNNQQLFILYDRLDTVVNPIYWNKAVSPLIDYWRNNCEGYSNIAPKIFVRTDLFRQIEGTNTERMKRNIIRIEWTIGEVFGFFFKLIFSGKEASNAYWAIAQKVGIDTDYINNTRKSFEKFPKNQFKSMTRAEMLPLVEIFFGEIVMAGASLGAPWDYFEKELSNADRKSISLRPFINTLNENAIDKALAQTERHIKCIISSGIYASQEVRDRATESYFDDLAHDQFSKDLLRFREVIRTSIGEPFRYKSLKEDLFEELMEITFRKITDSKVVKTVGDLKSMIFANGIMAEKITTKGRYYQFAPIYWYSWGLVNSDLERDERKHSKKGSEDAWEHDPSKPYSGTINNNCDRVYSRYHKMNLKIDYNNGFKADCSPKSYDYADKEEVLFDIRETTDHRTGNPFLFAINVRPACEE